MRPFEDLYQEHVAAVYRFAMSLTGRRDKAEDLVSEAFLALYRNLNSIDESRLPGWLLTVVRNRARDLWRHDEVELRHRAEVSAAPTAPAGLPFEQWMLEGAGLKPVHRTCVMLRYVYGMTRAEIAAETGLSEMQVKGHLQYSLELLRRAYPRDKDR